jgi:hypothetical protein
MKLATLGTGQLIATDAMQAARRDYFTRSAARLSKMRNRAAIADAPRVCAQGGIRLAAKLGKHCVPAQPSGKWP